MSGPKVSPSPSQKAAAASADVAGCTGHGCCGGGGGAMGWMGSLGGIVVVVSGGAVSVIVGDLGDVVV